jgi:pyridoxamine 5'-phosphate oxidase
VLEDRVDLEQALAAARRGLDEEPRAVAPSHGMYVVKPITVEFWQRRHVRLRYRRSGSTWQRDQLWP